MATRPSRPGRLDRSPQVSVVAAYHRLLCADFAFFMSQLRDTSGSLLTVAPHHRRWCGHVANAARLVLLAPRTHGKSYLGLSLADLAAATTDWSGCTAWFSIVLQAAMPALSSLARL